MRLARKSTGWALLTAGSLGLSALAAPLPYAPVTPRPALMDPALLEAQERKFETAVELAWLADPATFPCQLSAHCRGSVLEISGLVPDEPVGQRALALARQHCPLAIEDKLLVQPGAALPPLPCNREVLCRTAVTRMAKHFGQHGMVFQITADATGQILVGGSIPSMQEKLEVSRRLSQLPGCSAVVNNLAVELVARYSRPDPDVTAASQSSPLAKPAPAGAAPIISAGHRPATTTPAGIVQVSHQAPAVVRLGPPPVPAKPAKSGPMAAKTESEPPASPYALISRQQKPEVKQDVKPAPIPVASPVKQRTGTPQATAGMLSNLRPTSPASTAGTPSAGRRPADLPGNLTADAHPLPEGARRSFVPGQPPPRTNLPSQQVAEPRAAVIPSNYQEARGLLRPMPRTEARPLPQTVIQTGAPPRPLPRAQLAPRQVAQAQIPVPSSPRPMPQSRQQPVKPPVTKPSTQKSEELASSPYAPRPRLEPRPATKKEAKPASRPQSPAAASAPLPPAPQPLTQTSAQNLEPRQSAAPAASPHPAADITAGLLSYLRQRIYQISGGRAREVDVRRITSNRLQIGLKVGSAQEGEVLAAKILALPELAPYQVDLEMKLGQ